MFIKAMPFLVLLLHTDVFLNNIFIVLCGSNVLHVLKFYINGIVEYVFSNILLLSLNVVYESSMLI